MINDLGQLGGGWSVVGFIFPMIYYGFAHTASVKSSTGKEGKYATKKFILPKMPTFKSHWH